MISERDQKRIRDDAYIARDALESLMYAHNLTEDYIKEKLNTVRNCVKFIEHFEEGKND